MYTDILHHFYICVILIKAQKRRLTVEEVAIQDCLDTTSHDGNHVVEGLGVVAVDPVENVEATVRAEGEEIVAGDALGLAGLGHHEQLGQDGDRLQVDGEGPEDFHHRELVVEH